MKKILLFILCSFINIFPLTACSGTFTVEPDAYNPNLHGQMVHFTVPVVYMEFIEEDNKNFDQKSLNIGKLLINKEAVNSLFDDKKTHVIEPIPIKMSFTVLESYWVRLDWFTREFAPDTAMVVLKDENGEISVTFRSLLIDTDRPELGKYER